MGNDAQQPTARRRHMITETDEIHAALDDAAACWPEDRSSPSRLLQRLVHEGHRAIGAQRRDEVARRKAAIRESSGSLSGVYGEDYLDELHRDWPA